MSEDTRKARLLLRLRQAGVTDRRVLGAMESVPRDLFLPDLGIDEGIEEARPILWRQAIGYPEVVAAMVAALDPGPSMKLLAVGIASGYHLAVLARLCRRVFALVPSRASLIEIERAFEALRLRNTTCRTGDARRGWPEAAPYERILIGEPGETPAPGLLAQLAEGGVMLMPLGPADGAQVLCRLRRTAEGITREPIERLRFASPLTGPGVEEGDAGAG